MYCSKKNRILMFLIMHVVCSAWLLSTEKHFVVVVPSFNNQEWCKLNLDSIFSQTYKNFRVIYVDDASTDNTRALVKKYVKERSICNFTMVENDTNQGCLANIYRAVHSCDDREIIVKVDGDDWFAHDEVLTILNDVYKDPGVWLTYGSCKQSPSGKLSVMNKKIPDRVIKSNAFRLHYLVWHHLQTFYSWLFKKIRKDDLMHNGVFFGVCEDWARMLPMLEMSGVHSVFIPECLYVWNRASLITDSKLRGAEQIEVVQVIKKMRPYLPLKEAPALTKRL